MDTSIILVTVMISIILVPMCGALDPDFDPGCDVPSSYQGEPPVVEPHMPLGGERCQVGTNPDFFHVTEYRCERRYCCDPNCDCDSFPSETDCSTANNPATVLQCYVPHTSFVMSPRYECCEGYVENWQLICVLPTTPVTTTSTTTTPSTTSTTTSTTTTSTTTTTTTNRPSTTSTTTTRPTTTTSTTTKTTTTTPTITTPVATEPSSSKTTSSSPAVTSSATEAPVLGVVSNDDDDGGLPPFAYGIIVIVVVLVALAVPILLAYRWWKKKMTAEETVSGEEGGTAYVNEAYGTPPYLERQQSEARPQANGGLAVGLARGPSETHRQPTVVEDDKEKLKLPVVYDNAAWTPDYEPTSGVKLPLDGDGPVVYDNSESMGVRDSFTDVKTPITPPPAYTPYDNTPPRLYDNSRASGVSPYPNAYEEMPQAPTPYDNVALGGGGPQPLSTRPRRHPQGGHMPMAYDNVGSLTSPTSMNTTTTTYDNNRSPVSPTSLTPTAVSGSPHRGLGVPYDNVTPYEEPIAVSPTYEDTSASGSNSTMQRQLGRASHPNATQEEDYVASNLANESRVYERINEE